MGKIIQIKADLVDHLDVYISIIDKFKIKHDNDYD